MVDGGEDSPTTESESECSDGVEEEEEEVVTLGEMAFLGLAFLAESNGSMGTTEDSLYLSLTVTGISGSQEAVLSGVTAF